MSNKKKESKESRIQLFGRVDRKGHRIDGHITSEYPAWMFPAQIEKMTEKAREMKQAEENQLVPYERLREHREGRKQLEDRLKMIKESTPRLSGAAKDKVAKAYEELGKRIADSMPTRDAMMTGRASARQESIKMTEPTEVLDPELAEATGVRLTDGRCSMNQLTRAWKICARALGEDSNPERLRKDEAYGRYRNPISMEEAERT
jgi:hypothetical protein